PSDVGRTYESVIRINSQSGKGGVAYIMEKHFGFSLPKDMHAEFGRLIQDLSDRTGREVTPRNVKAAFEEEYLLTKTPYAFIGVSGECPLSPRPDSRSSAVDLKVVVAFDGREREVTGAGNGPIDAFSNAIRIEGGADFVLLSYYEHALTTGSDSRAVAYVKIEGPLKKRVWGVGVDTNINIASFKAIVSALNRMAKA
ncbi:MAG: alpha-isopropylmalate synthase regulatory domain-containing protein, partial [Thermodesulfobacteriota bacterium]